MAFRTFIDSAGHEWQVYDVIPRREERRRYDRRASRRSPDDALAAEALDRREDDERRLSVGRQSGLAPVREGWLCFERGEERRRLSPIPESWASRSDAELEQLREVAREVRPRPARTPPASSNTAMNEPKP